MRFIKNIIFVFVIYIYMTKNKEPKIAGSVGSVGSTLMSLAPLLLALGYNVKENKKNLHVSAGNEHIGGAYAQDIEAPPESQNQGAGIKKNAKLKGGNISVVASDGIIQGGNLKVGGRGRKPKVQKLQEKYVF